ncbi:hypothetical protein [Cellulosilyticum ruminicola]|uniref:hypothetical protein n=1 Tax=Cellulosilyticum ruminicola TaxID=425254 RepID=UPI0006CF79F1|nr:hypothetical protein [Cellulosilyticum ruminicola]
MNEVERLENRSKKEIYCNCCGKPIIKTTLKGVTMDYLHIEKEWGYFSNKDLTRQKFNVCERCFDKWISTFEIPVEESLVEDIYVYTDEEMEILSAAYKASGEI